MILIIIIIKKHRNPKPADHHVQTQLCMCVCVCVALNYYKDKLLLADSSLLSLLSPQTHSQNAKCFDHHREKRHVYVPLHARRDARVPSTPA